MVTMEPANIAGQGKLVLPGVCIYDNVLDARSFNTLANVHSHFPSESVSLHSGVDPENIGSPAKRGKAWHVRLRGDDTFLQEGIPDPLIQLAEKVIILAKDADEVFGVGSRKWNTFSLTPWTFYPGTMFEAHTDGPESFFGGFIFFAMHDWRLNFGGLLIILDAIRSARSIRYIDEEHVIHSIRDASEERFSLRSGISQVVHPIPNRLVLLAPDVVHMVTRVELAARNSPRQTIVGFFSACRV